MKNYVVEGSIQRGVSQMLEKLYDRPIGEYIARLSEASKDVSNGMCTLEEAIDLYRVSAVDLRQLHLEQKEWHEYTRDYGYEGAVRKR
jgi:hypothetical protein